MSTIDPYTDYYQVLAVSPQATQAEIKQAYRHLAKQAHPDSQAAAASHEAIVRLNAAYEVLSDRHRRQAYDRQRQNYANQRNARSHHAQTHYAQTQAQQRDRRAPEVQLNQWLHQIYRPINRQIDHIRKPLKQQVNELAADPFDDDLMADFVAYVEGCRDRLTQAQDRFRQLPNPGAVAGTAASLYYCLNHIEDGLNELEWFTNNYDEHYLHTGVEFFRLATQLQRDARSRLPNLR